MEGEHDGVLRGGGFGVGDGERGGGCGEGEEGERCEEGGEIHFYVSCGSVFVFVFVLGLGWVMGGREELCKRILFSVFKTVIWRI